MRLFWYAAALLVTGIIPTSVKADGFIKAGEWYSIDPDYLRANAWQKSHYNPTAINTNKSDDEKPGSSDYGIMQINSVSMRRLQKE